MKKSKIRERISAVLVGALIAGILMVSSAFPASAVSVSYTTDADFSSNSAEFAGVNHDAVHDQLQLNKTSTAFPFIWVPNTYEGTISKIDTRTGNELGRYRVTPLGLPDNGSPSRTTVDLDGNVWVGNRRAGTVVKVGLNETGQCIDRNGNGTIETSRDNDNDGNITGSEILPWGQDECVLYEVVLIPGSEGTFAPGTYAGPYDTDYWGTAPRGLAIDKNNNLWAGTSTTYKYFYINGTTGTIITSINVTPWSISTNGAYGATIDKNGILWSAMLSNGVLRINTSDLTDIRKIDIGTTYGIGLDFLNHLFVAGGNDLTKVDTNDVPNPIIWNKSVGAIRGVVATSDNNLWVAGYNASGYYNSVSRFDNDGNLLATISNFSSPSGVAVDAAGKVWVSDIDSEYIHRIDPSTNKVDLSKRIIGSGGHYTYSDMTGFVARTITTYKGTWTVTYDSGSQSTNWGRISWNASIPAGANIDVKIRTANYSVDLTGLNYQSVSNGVDFSATGQFIQIQTTLTANPAKESPILYDMIVESISAPSISGTKFNDSNGNGIRDSGESGVPGIGIRLTDITDSVNTSFAGFTVTDINGNYSFRNLKTGAYYRIEEVPSGYEIMSQTLPSGGSPYSITYDPLFPDIDLTKLDFGNQPVSGGGINGFKFNDSNGNGLQDAGETGIPGVVICLWPSLRCTATDSSGNYSFSNVALGTQTVYERVQPGFAATTPQMVTVTVSSGNNTTVNFGNRMLVPKPADVTVLGAMPEATEFYGVPAVLTADPVVIQKNLSNIAPFTDIVSVTLTLKWSDGTTRTASMTGNDTTNIWEATLGQPFPSGVAQMNFSVDVAPAGPENNSFQIGDVIFIDPSGQIQDACTGAPISGATVTLWWEKAIGHFNVSPPVNQIPPDNPLTTGADGYYSWMTIPGVYKVMAEKAGYVTNESDPVIVREPVTNLNIRLTPVEKVTIDIKPGTFPNSINLGSSGSVPVAILSSPTFDATTVDPLTVTLASAPVKLKGQGTPMASKQDVNGDGLLDLVVQVSTSALDLSSGDTEATLEGNAYCGKKITGSDSVRIVPP